MTLAVGDLFVVPRGVFHRPHTEAGASIALFEGAGVVEEHNARARDTRFPHPVYGGAG